MAKSFKILQEQLNAKLTQEQRAKSEQQFQQMLADINKEVLEPDVAEWLLVQNSDIKDSINNMVRAVMNAQKQALQNLS